MARHQRRTFGVKAGTSAAPRNGHRATSTDSVVLPPIPPHDLDAERALLGACLLEGTRAVGETAETLAGEAFYSDAHRIIFETMVALAARNAPVDLITLSDELRRTERLELVGGPAALALLVEQASIAAHRSSYAEIVRRHFAARSIIQAATRTIAAAYRPDALPTELAQALRDDLERLDVGASDDALRIVSWADMTTGDPTPIAYLWPGWIPLRSVTILAGAGESCKSWLLLQLAIATAAGLAPFPELDATPCPRSPVLYVTAENSEQEERRRATLLRRGLGLDASLPLHFVIASDISLSREQDYQRVLKAIRAHRPGLVCLDSAIALAGLENENDNARVREFTKARVQPFARHEGATVIMSAHSPKPQTQPGRPALTDEKVTRGAGDWRNGVDMTIYARRDPTLAEPPDTAIVLRHAKARIGLRAGHIWLRLADVDDGRAIRLTFGGRVDDTSGTAEHSELARAVRAGVETLRDAPTGIRLKDLLGAVVTASSTSKATARRAIDVLRGRKPWPAGQWKGQGRAVVGEDRAAGVGVLLTFRPTEYAAAGLGSDDDQVPF